MREMKDSGIPWIGEVPASWRVERIKTIYEERTELSETGQEDLLSVSEYYGVDKRASKVDEGEFVSRSENLIGYKKCYVDDFVSNIMLAWKGSFGTTNFDGIVSPAYCVYKPSKDIFPRYYHHLFRTSLYTGRFKCFSKGVIDSRLRLYSPYFFDVEALIPPLWEQKLIADYLDRKCGEIDELVVLQEKMIEELKSYKQSVITEAVTKGLNPNAPMKDSGIEWIGEIPEGWEISRIKNHSHFVNGFAFDSNIFKLEEAVPVIRIGDIAATIDYNSCVKVPFSSSLEQYTIKNNDILIAMSGATTGKCCFVSNAETAYINQRVGIVRSEISKYLYYSLQAAYFYEYVSLNSAGSAQPNISSSGIGEFMIAIPRNATEINAIADYLDEKCAEIDSLIALKQQKIEHLKEYKKSLIYEYVTGKKQVASADSNALPSA